MRDEPGETGPGNLFEPDPGWTGTDGGFNEETKCQAAGTACYGARYVVTAGAALAPALLGRLLLRKGAASGGSRRRCEIRVSRSVQATLHKSVYGLSGLLG